MRVTLAVVGLLVVVFAVQPIWARQDGNADSGKKCDVPEYL